MDEAHMDSPEAVALRAYIQDKASRRGISGVLMTATPPDSTRERCGSNFEIHDSELPFSMEENWYVKLKDHKERVHPAGSVLVVLPTRNECDALAAWWCGHGDSLGISLTGVELEKSLTATRDKDLTILVFRASAEWETTIDLLKGVLIIGIGTLKLKKRRDGKGAAHKVRGRERAAAKADEKTAEEAKETAGSVHDFDSDDEEAMH
jgi:hypothetical protein